MSGDKGRVVAEIAAAFLGGGDEPATWAAYAYEAGWDAAIEAAARAAMVWAKTADPRKVQEAIRALKGEK